MDAAKGPSTSLFDVFLRFRPPHAQASESFVDLDEPSDGCHTHITVKPPVSDGRKRAIEKFGFTRIFEEKASQQDIFNGVSLLPQLEGILASGGKAGKDALLATLGVTGSGKVCNVFSMQARRTETD